MQQSYRVRVENMTAIFLSPLQKDLIEHDVLG